MIQQDSRLWLYLSPFQRNLVVDGTLLINDCHIHPKEQLSDYSYLVFPFAKLYEGYLKQLLFDLGIIEKREYRSDHFRIGKALSPHLVSRLGIHSAYGEIAKRYGDSLALRLWDAWKEGRNLVFHYYPHNFRALTFDEAKQRIDAIIQAMKESVEITNPRRVSKDTE